MRRRLAARSGIGIGSHTMRIRYALFLPIAILVSSGCVRYQPKPLTPSQTETQLNSRTLDDAGLKAFIAISSPEAVKDWPRPSWDVNALTLAAFYYHPSLDVVRSQVGAAVARVITAGARPNPSLSFAPGYTESPESPWLFSLSFDLPVETAGKRGLRIAHAKQLTEAARLQLAETGWQVRSRVRAALLEYLLARRSIELLEAEIALRSTAVHLMERRFAVGEVSRTETDAARTQMVQGRMALHTAEGRAAERLVELAAALGLSPQALGGVTFEWPELEELPGEQEVSPEAVQRSGLLNRLDVRRSLVEYAAAETALQLEVAKQYPDLHFGPGYEFDDGLNKYKLGVTLSLPLLNQNQGPIAEATARREQVAARFLALQARVIGELYKAHAQYGAALAELKEVDTSLTDLQERTEKFTRRAVELGEADRLALASVQLQSIVVRRARLEALQRAQTALGALEDAEQRPLAPAMPLPNISQTDPRTTPEQP